MLTRTRRTTDHLAVGHDPATISTPDGSRENRAHRPFYSSTPVDLQNLPGLTQDILNSDRISSLLTLPTS
ncbi:hypothetical protein DPEC_G00050250 [Dallia pectoralis]|uniref:Uncharacterized protein n=1 Tax=Dallia pectoralis TaxID=75939 RepID=A0ACC2HBU6_DALPE|nr:hypothetical protein DPEC_G00050250 [Dallia pectoralis]